MEIILAIVVAAAVIFFGALISMGNERQRRAIDALREQVVLWAIQDLRMKREKLIHDVHIEDPLGWLNKIVSKACGHDLTLQVIEHVDNPQVLICKSGDGGVTFFVTPLSPYEIRAMKRAKHNRLSQYADRNPLLSLPRNATAFELSILNSGILFDLELAKVWKGLTNQQEEQMEHLWVYLSQ
jgi:hypothetical protein